MGNKEKRWCAKCRRAVEAVNDTCPRCGSKTPYTEKEHVDALGDYFDRQCGTSKRVLSVGKKPNKDCDHLWEQTGHWHGVDKNRKKVGGPKAKCWKCNKAVDFTWQEWKALPKRTRIGGYIMYKFSDRSIGLMLAALFLLFFVIVFFAIAASLNWWRL